MEQSNTQTNKLEERLHQAVLDYYLLDANKAGLSISNAEKLLRASAIRGAAKLLLQAQEEAGNTSPQSLEKVQQICRVSEHQVAYLTKATRPSAGGEEPIYWRRPESQTRRRRTRSRSPALSPSPELAPTPQATPEWVRNATPIWETSTNWYRNISPRSLSPQSRRTKNLINRRYRERVAARKKAIANWPRRSPGVDRNRPAGPEQASSRASQQDTTVTPSVQTCAPQGPGSERGRPRVRLPPKAPAPIDNWSRSPFRHPRPPLPPIIYPKDRDQLKRARSTHNSGDEQRSPPRKWHTGRGGRGRSDRGRGGRPDKVGEDQGPFLRGLVDFHAHRGGDQRQSPRKWHTGRGGPGQSDRPENSGNGQPRSARNKEYRARFARKHPSGHNHSNPN